MTCIKCKCEMIPSKAILNTSVSCNDDAPDGMSWMRFGGSGELVDCLKCPICGRSVK